MASKIGETVAKLASEARTLHPSRPEALFMITSRLQTQAAALGSNGTECNEPEEAEIESSNKGYMYDCNRDIKGVKNVKMRL
jgi:hypothetical protein